MVVPWWGIFIGLAVIAVLIAKIFHLLYRIGKLEELVQKLEGIDDEERFREEEDWGERKNKKSLLELDDIDERRDSGGG